MLAAAASFDRRCVQPLTLLCMYAAGRTTGLVLDCGDGSTTAVPVYEGFAVSSAITRSDIGGRDVTDHLQQLLRRTGVALTTSAEREVVREMKEKVCEVDQRPRSDSGYSATTPTVTYRLPDGNVLTLAAERSRAAEVLFTPSIIGCEDSGAFAWHAAARAAAQLTCELRCARRRHEGGVQVRPGNVTIPPQALLAFHITRVILFLRAAARLYCSPSCLAAAARCSRASATACCRS